MHSFAYEPANELNSSLNDRHDGPHYRGEDGQAAQVCREKSVEGVKIPKCPHQGNEGRNIKEQSSTFRRCAFSNNMFQAAKTFWLH